jgi:16S rRNA processing protein RimM
VDEDKVIVGRVGKTHGIHGWVKIISYTEPKKNILSYQPWLLKIKNSWLTKAFLASRLQGNDMIVLFEDCETIESARQYTGAYIAVLKTKLPQLEEETYYWVDLMGLTVITTTGIQLGKVAYLFTAGFNDVLLVKGKDKERAIPYLPNFIKEVDLKLKIITVDWDPDF